MKVTYIDHSGFLLETEDAYFLFDYYKGKIPDMDDKKTIVVFVSHSHHDHFNPEIFKQTEKKQEVYFVLSYDISLKNYFKKYNKIGIDLENKITVVGYNENRKLTLFNGNNINISTLNSTDEGVAFLLKYNNWTYYHAGDLNCWDWEEESEEYRNEMMQSYMCEMEKIKGMNIDIAFVPLDPRLENTAFRGMEIFMKYTKSKVVFPMHFWGDYSIIKKYLDKYSECKNQILEIQTTGQIFNNL